MDEKSDVSSRKYIEPAEEIAISEARKERKIAIQEAKESERRTVQEIIDTAERAISKVRDIKEKAILKAKAAEKDIINNSLEAMNKARVDAKEAIGETENAVKTRAFLEIKRSKE